MVNLKKSIAGQLQLDITGVRGDGYNKYSGKEGEKASFNVYEVNKSFQRKSCSNLYGNLLYKSFIVM